MSAAKPQKKMWKKVRDAVNRNGIVRRISIRKSSRVKKYPSRAPDYEPEEKDLLLAQVYTLFVDGEQQRWERILDGIVTLSVVCEQASPKYVYHITTVDSELQGLLDAYITVPGTQVVRCTSSFIQWKDSDQGGAWGLNFLSKDHADKFIDLCTPTDDPKLKRSNSSGCLSKSTDIQPPTALDFREHTASLDHLDDFSDDDLPATNIDDITVDDDNFSGSDDTPICTSTPTGSTELRSSFKISGSVRRKLVSRNSGQDIKYATYSASRRSMFTESYYDNVNSDEDDDDINSFLSSKALDNSNHSNWNDSSHSHSLNQKSKKYKETDIDDIRGQLDLLGDRTLQKPQLNSPVERLNSPRINSPKRTLSKRSEASSVASSSQSSNTPQQAKVVMEQGVLKSAKFVEENSSHFGLANAGKVPNSNDSLHENRNSTCQEYDMELPRPRTYTDSQATYSVTDATDPIVRNKRAKSLYAGGPISLPPEDADRNDSRNSDRNDSRNSDQSNDLVQAYEHELKLQALSENCDSGFDGMGPESESLTTRSASSGQPSLNAKSRKRWGTGSDSGSSSGVRGDGGTLTSSEGRYSAHMDINFFEGKQFEDEEDGEDDSESISSHHTQASCFQQRGAIRKAGWLTVKSMLVQRKKKVERAAKRKWKDYWVCLKGTMLLFYHCDEKNAPDDTSEPRHVLVVEGSIAQAVPEHTKRDNIFCLSTAFGDAYLLQATTQTELENWMTAIHSACSSAFARQHGKDDTLRLLTSEVKKLEAQIDSETKMKKMAELQITVVKDARNKQAIVTQISQWDQNLEKFHLELYRLRCYMASLQGSELPNPKVLLACVSKPTKHALARLGIFSVSSFHAIVSSRNPVHLQGRFSKKSSKKQKSGLFGTLRRSSHKTLHRIDMGNTQPVNSDVAPLSPRQVEQEYDIIDAPNPSPAGMTNGDYNDNTSLEEGSLPSREESISSDGTHDGGSIKVLLPNNQSTMVTVKPGMTVHDLLITSCMHRQMDYHNHYVRLKQALKSGATHHLPDKMAKIYNEKFDEIEICVKSIHQVELYRFDETKSFGLLLEAELGDDAEQEDQLCVFISEIVKGGMAYHQDLQVGDELLVINGSVVCDQDMLHIENLLQNATTLTMTIRSCRSLFAQNQAMVDTNKYIDQLTCPPPPSQTRLTDEMIDNLIVPAPVNFDDENDTSGNSTLSYREPTPMKLMYDPVEEETAKNEANMAANQKKDNNPQEIADLLKNAEQITEFCRLRDQPCDEEVGGQMESSKRQLQAAQKLRKVIMELIDTERTYVKDLNCLVTRYLEPLQNESFLSADEIDALFGNVKEIIKFQSIFLKALDDATKLEKFDTLEDPAAFKRILIALSGAFLYHMEYFKLYSSFCACHSRAQKILDPSKGNQALNDFLDARNPKHQHSSSLSSYLIKPIQRVLKYPLLLREIRSQLDTDSEEHYHLSGAHKGMEEVAGHINDMMRVHEEYGDVFDSLVAQQYHVKKEVADLAMDDLVLYNMASWLNAEEELGKVKKGKDPEVIIFIFRPAVVIIYKEKGKKKKMSIVSGTSSMKALPPEDVIRYKWMIPISLLQLKDSSISDSDYLSLWEVIHTKSDGRAHEKVFQFSCSTTDRKNTFIKAIRQCLRDYNRIKNMPNASKFKKNYTPYGGQRLEGLSRSKRTLRKSLKSSEGSQGSEERSSESGSREDESMDTDSNSTGTRLSMYKASDMLDPFRYRSDSMGSRGSRGSRGSKGSKGSKGSRSSRKNSLLNTNSNNNIEDGFVVDSAIPPEFDRSDSNTSDVFLPETPQSLQSEVDTPRSYLSEDTECSTLLGTQVQVLADDEIFCAEIATPSSPTAEEINQRLQALDLSLTCQQLTPDPAEENKTFDANHSPTYPGDIATINRTLYKSPSVDKDLEGSNMPKPSSLYDNLDKIGLDPSTESALLVELASKLRNNSSNESEQSGRSSSSCEV